MVLLDIEKRVAPSVRHENIPPRLDEMRSARRRVIPRLVVIFLAVVVVLSIRSASDWPPSAKSRFRGHGDGLRADPAELDLASQAIQSRSPSVKASDAATTSTSAAAPTRTVLKTFEVAQPVLLPGGPAESDGSTRHGKDYSPELCTVMLMRHDFAWSYDAPFVGDYIPPACDFNRVVLNFSVVSEGRQFDRLAIMYFGDTEVWRTSTAEPTAPPGISWIYLKDMTQYLYFWKSPQKIIFDLGNLINDKYTGIFNTTMTAIFYNSDVVTDQGPPSDVIIPISSRRGANDSVSQFTLPAQNATNTISFPRNALRAVFSVSANGQASEEFWWSNVLQSDVYTFNATAGQLPGLSPFREVQVLIDGQLAGVQWPFPVIFTGGVVPSLHRPIVGIHAFDLREHEIDITPFLPVLCDGAEHTFTIRVAGLNDTGDGASPSLTESVNESWYVTGKIFVWLDDDASSITTGDPPTIHHPPPVIATTRLITTARNGTNETLRYTTSVERTLQISTARLRTQRSASPSAFTGKATWSQNLRYTNTGFVTAFGYGQVNDLLIAGHDEAQYPHLLISSGANRARASSPPSYSATYRYPLSANSTYAVTPQGNLSIWAHLRQGKEVAVAGASVFPSGLEAFLSSSSLSPPSSSPPPAGLPPSRSRGVVAAVVRTSKEGTAEFHQSGDGRESSGWGDARQVFRFGTREFAGKTATGTETGTETEQGAEKELYYRNVSAVNGSVVADLRRMNGKVVGGSGGTTGGGGGAAGKGGKGVVSYGDW